MRLFKGYAYYKSVTFREATAGAGTNFSWTERVPHAIPCAMKNGDHLFLVDGSGFIFRAFHALPPLNRKSDGLPVSAVSGFCNMLWKLLTGCAQHRRRRDAHPFRRHLRLFVEDLPQRALRPTTRRTARPRRKT